MIILKSGTKKYSVKEISFNLLNYCEGLVNIKKLSLNKLMKIPGIGKVKAVEIVAIIELMKRIDEDNLINEVIYCTNPESIINYFNNLFKEKKQEEFYVIYLDNKKRYIDKMKLFVGSINNSIVHPREIFKNAYLLSASYIICIHNHPSGDATPSIEDVSFTEKIFNISLLHSIYLVDHIIVGRNCYYSFYEDENIIKHN